MNSAFEWVKNQLGALQALRQSKTSDTLKYVRHDITDQVQGPLRRSKSANDPSQNTQEQNDWLTARFQSKSGYLFFNNSIYSVIFKKAKPIIQPCELITEPTPEQWEQISDLFPEVTAPVKQAIDEELTQILDKIKPITSDFPTFNSQLLRSYFVNNAQRDLPFVEFSNIKLLKIETLENFDLPTLINNDNIPTLIFNQHNNSYYLYGNYNGWEGKKLDYKLVHNLSLSFGETSPTLLEYNILHTPLYLHIIAKKAHQHLSIQPEQVTQIQKTTIALSYLETVFSDIETRPALGYMSGDLYDNARQAWQILTNMDIDFALRFQQDISEVLFLIQRFEEYSKAEVTPNNNQQANSWSYQLGYAAGFVTSNLYASNGILNAEAISKLSSELPQHIDMITTFIHDQTPTITQHAPNINPDQLKALQSEAEKLSKILNNYQTSALGPFQIIQYIYLIRQVMTLLSTTLGQVGHLNNAYQELLRTYLRLLKYQLFPKIFALIDKLEIELMLTPGSLSHHAMRHITDFYAFLMNTVHLKDLADFSFRGEELLVVEDARFMAKRREAIQHIANESHNTTLLLSWARTASDDFFNSDHTTTPQMLKDLYLLIAPYLKKIDPHGHIKCMTYINNPERPSETPSYFVLLLQKLTAHFHKIEATQKLRLQQCAAIQHHIDTHAALQVFPYGERNGCELLLLKLLSQQKLTDATLKDIRPDIKENFEPILIQTKDNYYLWGNTDGTRWILTQIDAQFIDRSIIDQFNNLSENHPHKLKHNKAYNSLYDQMIIKKAHTHYLSQFDCSENKVFTQEKRLSEIVLIPVDYVHAQLFPANTLSATPWSEQSKLASLEKYYDNDPNYLQIKDANQLNSTEALAVYRMYVQKEQDFEDAKQTLAQLKILLNAHFTSTQTIEFTPNSQLQKKCRILYSCVQPYLLGIDNFPIFDQMVCNALSDHPNPVSHGTLTVDIFNKKVDKLSFENMKRRIHHWGIRSKKFLERAETAYRAEHEANLTSNVESHARKDFLIKTNILSTSIAQIQQIIQSWIQISNKNVRKKLQPQSRELPYVISDSAHLHESDAVLFFKRLSNTLYHIKHMTLKLENMKTVPGPYQTLQDLEIAQIDALIALNSEHIQPLRVLCADLFKDPYIRSNVSSFYTHVTEITALFTEITKPYTTKEHTIQPVTSQHPSIGSRLYTMYTQSLESMHSMLSYIEPPVSLDQGVKFNGLWYSVNALSVFPKQLLHATQQEQWDKTYTLLLKELDANTLLVHPVKETPMLIKQGERYQIFGKNDQGHWQFRTLVDADIVRNINVDFSQSCLLYDEKYEPFYQYLAYKDYHVTEFYKTQMVAKQSVLNIEYLIQNAHSYPKLLLSVLMVYALNNELRSKFSRLTETTHDVIISHLEDIQKNYFATLLKKVDNNELQLELTPGTLAGPIKKALDDWYQGLLYPLKMSFRDKEILVCTDVATQERIKEEQKNHVHTSTQITQTTKELAQVNAFLNGVSDYQKSVPSIKGLASSNTLSNITTSKTPLLEAVFVGLAASMIVIMPAPDLSTDITDEYANIVALLKKLQTDSNNQNKRLPTWLNDIKTKITKENVTDIYTQVSEYKAYLVDTHDTYNRILSQSQDKIRYLQTILNNSDLFQQHYRQSFSQDYFEEQLNQYTKQNLGFCDSGLQQEYLQELKIYLTGYQRDLLSIAHYEEAPDDYLHKKMKALVENFKKDHLFEFKQADDVSRVIQTFTKCIIEDKTLSQTLKENKIACLKTLTNLIHPHANGNPGPLGFRLSLRLDAAREYTANNKDILLAQEPTAQTFLTWLVECVFALLEAIGLYTPKMQRHYSDLLKKSEFIPLSHRTKKSYFDCFGFFSGSTTESANPINVNQPRNP